MSETLKTFLKDIKKEKKTVNTTPKEILKKYGVAKRGWRVNTNINNYLNEYDLFCEPEFANAYIYGKIEIKPKPTLKSKFGQNTNEKTDPIPKISLLKSSNLNNIDFEDDELNNGLISINKETTITKAISLMIKYNFSQLPILSSKREVYGLISWKTIGKKLSLGHKCETVADCYEKVEVLKIDEPLFKAVKIILENEVILVKGINGEVSGILTTTDLGEQFLNMSEPFLILEQIENLIREILNGKLIMEDINRTLDLEKIDKKIEHLTDLSFGHYCRIFSNESIFNKLNLNIDRPILLDILQEVRLIRNDVMHFNHDKTKSRDLQTLYQALNFLHTIIH